eukprot:3604274-Prymnesium_polylepis.1
MSVVRTRAASALLSKKTSRRPIVAKLFVIRAPRSLRRGCAGWMKRAPTSLQHKSQRNTHTTEHPLQSGGFNPREERLPEPRL